MNAWSAALYRRLEEAGGDRAPGWVESGSLRLASSPQRLEEIRRQAAWAQRAGLPLELISAQEAAELFPLMSTDGVLGAAYTPTDGQVDPARLCYALAASARAAGVTIAQRTRVTAITTDEGGVTGVRTDRGDVECEVVVDCGGMFAAEIARLAGVRVPIVPMSHQYVVTEAFLPAGTGAAAVAARSRPAGLLPAGGRRPGHGRLRAAQRAVDRDCRSRSTPCPPTSTAGCSNPTGTASTEIVENAQVRVPALGDVGVRSMINGPEAFTPDNEFCLGETRGGRVLRRRGLLRARHRRRGRDRAGAWRRGSSTATPGWTCGTWTCAASAREYRSPGYTLARVVENYESYYDIRPPGSQRSAGRPLRISPAYPWHAAHGAVFGEKAGWERVEYYAQRRRARASDDLRPARLGRARLVAVGRARAPGRARGRGAVRRVVLRQDRDHRTGGARVRRARLRRPRRRAGRGGHLHPGAGRPRRRRHGRDRDPRGARGVPRGHRHGVGPARPGLAARPGARSFDHGADRRRHRGLGLLRAVGSARPRRARPADARGPVATRRSRT